MKIPHEFKFVKINALYSVRIKLLVINFTNFNNLYVCTSKFQLYFVSPRFIQKHDLMY